MGDLIFCSKLINKKYFHKIQNYKTPFISMKIMVPHLEEVMTFIFPKIPIKNHTALHILMVDMEKMKMPKIET
jgi:hypothetical protein